LQDGQMEDGARNWDAEIERLRGSYDVYERVRERGRERERQGCVGKRRDSERES